MTLLRGGDVNLILAPGMVLDGNELSARHGTLAISRDPGPLSSPAAAMRSHNRLAPEEEMPGAIASWTGGRARNRQSSAPGGDIAAPRPAPDRLLIARARGVLDLSLSHEPSPGALKDAVHAIVAPLRAG
jgi:hypothetical protein